MGAQWDDAGLTEVSGKWLLPVGDGKVTQLRVDYAFTLVLESWIGTRSCRTCGPWPGHMNTSSPGSRTTGISGALT